MNTGRPRRRRTPLSAPWLPLRPVALASTRSARQTWRPAGCAVLAILFAACATSPLRGGVEPPSPGETPSPASASLDRPPATGLAQQADAPDQSCELRATFLQDLAIPDNTPLAPAEPFTKSWRLRNDGTCVWDEDYVLTFIGGDRMAAASGIPLQHAVLPGGTVDLSIDMLAPEAAGTYQGFWKLADAHGRLFGVGGDGNLSFWVKIEVRSEPPPRTVSVPEAPAVSLGPAEFSSGRAALPPGIPFDLDTGLAQIEAGADIVWRTDLLSQGRARVGTSLSSEAAATTECEADVMMNASVPADDLLPGASICYRTDQGRIGRLSILETGEALRFEYTTWEGAAP